MKAIILAAGIGERLRPLTNEIPKVMANLNGKPCIQHIIELLKKSGVTDIYIDIWYRGEQIKDYFLDGRKLGVNIAYFEEKFLPGTSGVLNNIRGKINDSFLVVYGDVLYEAEIDKIIEAHYKNKGIATIALDERPQKGKGVVILDKNNRITSFVEKPEKEIPNGLINSGIYVLNPEILDYIPKTPSDFGKQIFPKILEAGEKMYGFKIKKVIDIGTYEDLEKARAYLRDKAKS